MPEKVRVYTLLMLLLFSSSMFSNELKHVLVLHSYFPNQGWALLANEGIMSTLHKEKELPITVDIRFLDMRNDPDKLRLEQIKSNLRTTYPDESVIDLLIVVDDLALEYVNEKGNELFPSVPIIFCSAKNYQSLDFGGRQITGVSESIGFLKNVRLAKQLLPKTETVLFLNSENLPTGQGHLTEFKNSPPQIDGIEVKIWRDSTKASLQKAIEELPENSVLFYGITSFTDDREMDLIFNLHDFSFFWENSNAAVFSHNFDLINSGFMGGYTIKAEEIGKEAALMAIEYLKGKPIAELPVKLIYPEHLTLNYNTLKKHNVPVNNITNKSILINYNPTFWNLYKNVIITVSIILIIQFVLIILLFVQKKALRQSHAELKVAKQTAEESTQMKKAFLANMNHEIRTPLNAIVGFSNLLYEENLDEQEKKKYLDLLNLNSEMLLNMVSDLLDLSKIESGNLDIYPRKVAISKIIQEVFDTANLLRFEKEKSAVRFTLDIPETNVVYYVNTDTYRLKQILFNLIINTLKSMDGGNAKLGYKLSQESVSFFVENPKLRLDRKEKERIFEPFYRPMKAYTIFSNDSTVLANLSLIHKLANLLNGDLVVDDHEEGSIFYLTVPTTT